MPRGSPASTSTRATTSRPVRPGVARPSPAVAGAGASVPPPPTRRGGRARPAPGAGRRRSGRRPSIRSVGDSVAAMIWGAPRTDRSEQGAPIGDGGAVAGRGGLQEVPTLLDGLDRGGGDLLGGYLGRGVGGGVGGDDEELGAAPHRGPTPVGVEHLVGDHGPERGGRGVQQPGPVSGDGVERHRREVGRGGRRSAGRARTRRRGPGGPFRTGPPGFRPGPRPRSRCGRWWPRGSRSRRPPGWCGACGPGPARAASSGEYRPTGRRGTPRPRATAPGSVPSRGPAAGAPGSRTAGRPAPRPGRSGTCGTPGPRLPVPPPWTPLPPTRPRRAHGRPAPPQPRGRPGASDAGPDEGTDPGHGRRPRRRPARRPPAVSTRAKARARRPSRSATTTASASAASPAPPR